MLLQYYEVIKVSSPGDAAVVTEAPTAPEVKPTEAPTTEESEAEKPKEDNSEGKGSEEKPAEEKPVPDKSNYKAQPGDLVSRLHYLIPASKSNLHFCYNLLSSTATRWPIPTILGWHGTGELDAAVTHLAKLRTIDRYLNQLDEADDDDLVVIIDGYDILLQLPPEVMIERYFEVANKADAQLAKRFGINVKEARALGLRQTIFWGPDKVCWPVDHAASRCWAVPPSTLPGDSFGPNTGNGDMVFNNPRWLNSGTVIGRIDDMRTLINATLGEVEGTYNPEYQFKESDQFYVSNLWGRQEYYRSLQARNGDPPEGGPENKEIPTKRYENQTTEYHVSLDYESAMFQTRAGYEPFFGYLPFSTSGLNANMNIDMFEQGDNFVPYDIPMPANVYSALDKLYDSIPEKHNGVPTNDWIRTIKLGVNYVTKHIFPLFHCTGPKHFLEAELPKMWWFPYAKSLVKATAKAYKEEELITSHHVDGRKWASKNLYPADMEDELGGAWVDYDGATFVGWDKLCGAYEKHLFVGEYPELKEPENDGQDGKAAR